MPHVNVGWLLQGEDVHWLKFLQPVTTKFAIEVFWVTYKTLHENSTMYASPNLAAGRNFALSLACAVELERMVGFAYYMFTDGDFEWISGGLSRFLYEVQVSNASVAVPVLVNSTTVKSAQASEQLALSIANADHIVVAISRGVARELLPYNSDLDSFGCWWVSQWVFTVLAAVVPHLQVVLIPSAAVANMEIGKYNQRVCWVQFRAVSDIARRLLLGLSGCVVNHVPQGMPWGSIGTHGSCSRRDRMRAVVNEIA